MIQCASCEVDAAVESDDRVSRLIKHVGVSFVEKLLSNPLLCHRMRRAILIIPENVICALQQTGHIHRLSTRRM